MTVVNTLVNINDAMLENNLAKSAECSEMKDKFWSDYYSKAEDFAVKKHGIVPMKIKIKNHFLKIMVSTKITSTTPKRGRHNELETT